jgi:hypothetical protein
LSNLEDMEAMVDDTEAGPADVRALYDAEVAALLPEYVDPFAGPGAGLRGGVAGGMQGWACDNADGVGAVLDQIERDQGDRGGGGGGGGGGSCHPPAASGDPNDKGAAANLRCEFETVDVGGQPVTRCARYYLPSAAAGEPVEYTIRFENLAIANEPAEFVTITDELDPAFNPASLEVLGTSSDSTFSYSISGSTVTFRFVGINLPPNVTAPEGEGYVSFRVTPAAPLPDSAEVRNDATIVFDFNPPIVTPEVIHQVRHTTDVAAVVEAPEEASPGQPAQFRVLVGNLQRDAAVGTTVEIGSTAEIVSVVPSRGTCTGTAPVVCSLGDLAYYGDEEPVTIDVTAMPATMGELMVTAAAATTTFDAFLPNNTDAGTVDVGTTSTDDDAGRPGELTLRAPRPNPVRDAVSIQWGLPAPAPVHVRVFDLLGRQVAILADGETRQAGWHDVRWDADVASGVYVVQLRVGEQTRSRRLTVLR